MKCKGLLFTDVMARYATSLKIQ